MLVGSLKVYSSQHIEKTSWYQLPTASTGDATPSSSKLRPGISSSLVPPASRAGSSDTISNDRVSRAISSERNIRVSLDLRRNTALCTVTGSTDEIFRAILSTHKHKRQRSSAELFAEHILFRSVVNVAIITNALQMGIATELRGAGWETVWHVCDHLFTFIFAVEMTAKLIAYRYAYFLERWNKFDFAIAWLSIVDMWIIKLFTDSINTSHLKIFRLLRLLRMVRVVKMVPELLMVIEGIAASLRSMFWVFLLLVVIIYTCAIYCVQIIGNEDAGYAAYSTDAAALEVLARNRSHDSQPLQLTLSYRKQAPPVRNQTDEVNGNKRTKSIFRNRKC